MSVTASIRVISGGQAGADQAGLRAARACGLETGGHAPEGWMTEDGPAPWLEGFGLKQFGDYVERTRANVGDASAILWFGDPDSRGGRLTCRFARWYSVPLLIVWKGTPPAVVASWVWSARQSCQGEFKLMIAGNRESINPGIGARVEAFLMEVFSGQGVG